MLFRLLSSVRQHRLITFVVVDKSIKAAFVAHCWPVSLLVFIFINPRNLWCGYFFIGIHFYQPEKPMMWIFVYTLWFWGAQRYLPGTLMSISSRPADEDQVEYVSSSQCHKTSVMGNWIKPLMYGIMDCAHSVCAVWGLKLDVHTFLGRRFKMFMGSTHVQWGQGLFIVTTKISWVYESLFTSWRHLY